MAYANKRVLSAAVAAILLSGCGGDSGSSSSTGNDSGGSGGNGSDGGTTPTVGVHTITGSIVGGVTNLSIDDALNSLSTHSQDGVTFEIGKYSDGATYSLNVDSPVGKKCIADAPTGVINSDLNVVVTCNDHTYTPQSLVVTSTFDRDGVAYIQVEPSGAISAQSEQTQYNVMGRAKNTDGAFQLLGSATLNSFNQLVIDSLPSNAELEIYVVPDGVEEPEPELVSLVTNPPTEFYPGVIPSYMSDFQDLFLIESYYDDKNVLKVKFTPKNLDSMPDDWHQALESELAGTYLHGNVDDAIAEVFQLTGVSPQAQTRSLGQAQFLGSIKEVVFEAIERTFVEIRELADLDFSFRLKSHDGDGKAASISPYSSNLTCDFENVDNPYESVTNFKLPMVPTIPKKESSYDIYVEGKLKIRDGEYLPNDMYIHTEGYYASQLTYGMKTARIYDGAPIAASCYPVVVRFPIPMPYFPTAKVGNFIVQTGAELVFGKIEARGEYSITREFRYPFKTTIGVKDGDAQLSGGLGTFSNEIVASKSTLVGKAAIESGIVANVGIELSPGLTASVGKGTEFTLATTGLKFGAKIAGEVEAIQHVLVNNQALYSMEKIELGSGPVAEVELKLPPLPTYKPKKLDWAKPYFKPWKDWALPSYTAKTNQADLGAIVVGDTINIGLDLSTAGSDTSKIDFQNIQWNAVPAGSFEFSEFGPQRLRTTATPVENDAEIRQIVVTMSHKEGYEFLNKSILMNLNVTSKSCPDEEQFLKEVNRTKTDNNRVHIRPADASDPTQIGSCTIKLYETAGDNEWLETEAFYESGFLVNRDSYYQSGVIKQSDTFEIISLSTGAKVANPTRAMEQSEDEQTFTIFNYRNVLNADGSKAIRLQEGVQINQRGGLYTESNIGNIKIPGTDNYQQLLVGTQKNIYDVGQESESQRIKEYGLSGLVCDDGATVEKLLSESFSKTDGTNTTLFTYEQFNCPSARYAGVVNYLSEKTSQFAYSDPNETSIRIERYLPIFDTLPSVEVSQFNGQLSYLSEEIRTDYVGSTVSRFDYERYKLLTLPVGSPYTSRSFYGFDHLLEYDGEMYLSHTELNKYSTHEDDGVIDRIYESWFDVADFEGASVIVKTHQIYEDNEAESYYLTTLGKYEREVTEYSGDVMVDDRGEHHFEQAIKKFQYVDEQHQFDNDNVELDGETWRFVRMLFDYDASFHYIDHGQYGTYTALGSNELCESGTYQNDVREGYYFKDAGCKSTNRFNDDHWITANYSNDQYHGEYSAGHRDGSSKIKGTYINGKMHGWWSNYQYGNLTSKTKYENGKRIDSCYVGSESDPC